MEIRINRMHLRRFNGGINIKMRSGIMEVRWKEDQKQRLGVVLFQV